MFWFVKSFPLRDGNLISSIEWEEMNSYTEKKSVGGQVVAVLVSCVAGDGGVCELSIASAPDSAASNSSSRSAALIPPEHC